MRTLRVTAEAGASFFCLQAAGIVSSLTKDTGDPQAQGQLGEDHEQHEAHRRAKKERREHKPDAPGATHGKGGTRRGSAHWTPANENLRALLRLRLR